MLLTWCYGLTHNFSLPRATGCLHSSDREKTVSRNARKRYVSERACFYIPKGEKPRNFMGLEAKSYSTINNCSTVLGSTSNTRAVSRMPTPSAKHAMTRTMSSTEACLPCKSVPSVSRKEPRQATHSSCRQGPPLGWPWARRFPQATQPRYAQSGFGQKCVEVSTWRFRPRVEVIRGGGVAGAVTVGADSACSHATHWGVWVRPANDFGSLERVRRGRMGSAGLCEVAGH